MTWRCSFKRSGSAQCSNDPVDARLVDLPGGHGHIVALLCGPHTQAYDTIMYAERQRTKAPDGD